MKQDWQVLGLLFLQALAVLGMLFSLAVLARWL